MERVCPLLALATDGRTVIEGVDRGHACHALDEPMPLERQLQAQLCLTPRHDRCERYAQHVARRGAVPGRAAVADGLVSTRLALAPEPAWRGIAGRARRGRPATALAIGGAAVALTAAAGAVSGTTPLGGLSLVDSPSPSPTASDPPAIVVASPPPDPTPSATPAPTAMPSPSPTPAATPSPTPEPTPAPTPAPTVTGPRTYVVQEGDTLAEIAQRFGTTVRALRLANDIEDPDEIIIGETLVIP